MEKKDVLAFINECTNFDVLTEVKQRADYKISQLGVVPGNDAVFTLYYMVGDSSGNHETEVDFYDITQDQINAVDVVMDILSNHTDPNSGSWGFQLNSEDFSEKPEDIYNILYNQEDAPKDYNGIELTKEVLDEIDSIVENGFYDDTEYSFLTYEGYDFDRISEEY